jgi:hypothetical protein
MTGRVAARTGAAACTRVWRLLGAGAACIVLLALGATTAHAELSFSATFGAQGTGDGQFAAAQGIGVDQTTLDPSSGDVYVADTGNARVEQFNAAGEFISAWGWGVADGKSALEVCTSDCRAGIPGSGAGQFDAPTSIAVDSASGPTQGDVYVGDSANKAIDEFSPSGALLGTITGPSAGTTFQAVSGIAVEGEGNLWVADGGSANIYELSSGGALLTELNDNFSAPNAIAVDSAGDVYLLRGSGETEKWTASARASDSPVVVDNAQGVGLGVDQASNELYVDLGASIDQWGAAGESLGNFGSGALGYGKQMAYNPNVTLAGAVGPGALYVVDEADNRVAVFVQPAPASPTVLAGSENATGITDAAATLEASINANGLDTKYFFEYGSTTAYGTRAPLPPGTDLGSNHAVLPAKAALSGLAPDTAYHFRVVAVNSLGTTDGPDQTFTTATIQAPVVESETAVNVTSDAATLQALVNPEFGDTHYYFEYGPTAAYGSTSPAPPGADIGESNAAQGAETAIPGLNAGTTYHFRVVAVNSVGTTDGPDMTLTTAPPASIETESAANVTSTTADLTASLDPEGQETRYRIEYGTTTSYGSQAPSAEAQLPAAESAQSISVHVANLLPSTTYYFRVVATNSLGTVAGASASFTTYPPGESFSLPDNRAYELVSPPDKNGGDVGGESTFNLLPTGLGQSSASGSTITYASFTSFGDAQGSELSTQYLATRGPTGWTTQAISPPTQEVEKLELRLAPFHLFNPEMTAWIFSWEHPPLSAGALPEIENLYKGELGSDTYQLIDDDTPANHGYEVKLAGASSDLSHVVFEANEALTPGAPLGAWSVYEWTAGALRLVSVLPEPGEVAAENAHGVSRETSLPNAVSPDGSRIFWTDSSEQLYVREGGTTVQLNASQRTPSLGDGGALFRAATPDGMKVFFTDETPLTNAPDDHGGLYEYNFADRQLTAIAPDAAGSPGVAGVAAVSEDGTSVYFVASADLAGNAVAGADNLYLARAGQVTFIAALGSGDSGDWAESSEALTAGVTPDGADLVFMSELPLTGYDNADLITGARDTEVFLYNADAETLTCASCNPSGERPVGPASLPHPEHADYLSRYVSENGRQVFFDSKDALLPAASDGEQNVYEYEEGAIHLISSGASDANSDLADVSANGDNVFFTTRARLVPADQDENSDMYDARVDGGFPEAASPAPCSGEGCRGPIGAPPPTLAIATEETHGAESLPVQSADAAAPARSTNPHKVRKATHKARAQHAAHKARRSRGRRGAGHKRKARPHALGAAGDAAARAREGKAR